MLYSGSEPPASDHRSALLASVTVGSATLVARTRAYVDAGPFPFHRRIPSCTGTCYSPPVRIDLNAGVEGMAPTRSGRQRARVQRKNYRIDVTKLSRARRILGTRTETETVHRALDLVAKEAALIEALRDFVRKGKGRIEDIDGRR